MHATVEVHLLFPEVPYVRRSEHRPKPDPEKKKSAHDVHILSIGISVTRIIAKNASGR